MKTGTLLATQEKEMLVKVRCLASDGGPIERKLMFKLVRTISPGVALIVRELAHAARVAMQRPQQFDPELNAVHTHFSTMAHRLRRMLFLILKLVMNPMYERFDLIIG